MFPVPQRVPWLPLALRYSYAIGYMYKLGATSIDKIGEVQLSDEIRGGEI